MQQLDQQATLTAPLATRRRQFDVAGRQIAALVEDTRGRGHADGAGAVKANARGGLR